MTVLSAKFNRRKATRSHNWLTVVNPINQRSLLQACDDCGVVKSENSVARCCKAPKGRALISGAMALNQTIAI
ncbi:hypothetical protein [Arenicella xantha]|uniref:Uncharacterized protein n=1 Tax=Arenicella xantha TaxID=644221 RepID=A0A395JP15_9GAMM|nr:hypothetical protein [Arenicella xantha]RBP53384.1 hypothetical protein DFR28_101770 [Arenicella xantha]